MRNLDNSQIFTFSSFVDGENFFSLSYVPFLFISFTLLPFEVSGLSHWVLDLFNNNLSNLLLTYFRFGSCLLCGLFYYFCKVSLILYLSKGGFFIAYVFEKHPEVIIKSSQSSSSTIFRLLAVETFRLVTMTGLESKLGFPLHFLS